MERAAGLLARPGIRLAVYLAAAVLFVLLYERRTIWSPYTADEFMRQVVPPPFGHRMLVPWLVRALTAVSPATQALGFTLAGVVTVVLLLTAYRGFLAEYVGGSAASVLTLGILWPLLWNYCLLSTLYEPFDLPSVLFFTAGLRFLQRRRWALYYAVFLAGCLNRETILFLAMVFVLTEGGRMPDRSLALHAVAQLALWLGTRVVLWAAVGRGHPAVEFALATNLQTLRGMLLLTRHGVHDWLKLILAFGGLAWVVPFVLRGQPRFIRRALWLVPLYLVVLFPVAILDEMRVHAELVPLLAAPILIVLGRRMAASGGSGRPEGVEVR